MQRLAYIPQNAHMRLDPPLSEYEQLFFFLFFLVFLATSLIVQGQSANHDYINLLGKPTSSANGQLQKISQQVLLCSRLPDPAKKLFMTG